MHFEGGRILNPSLSTYRVQRFQDLPEIEVVLIDRDDIPSAGAGETPIVPIIVGETATAIQMSDLLLAQGVFVTGFGYPVVPQGQARVRCQLSAAHTRADLDEAIAAFKTVGRKVGILK